MSVLLAPPLKPRPAGAPPARTGLARLSVVPYLWLPAALALLCLQLLCGTSIAYALLIFLFLVLSVQTVRALGGLGTLMGACVGFLVFQHVVFSQICKLAFGQAADSDLTRPIETAGVYCVGMFGIYVAARTAPRLSYRNSGPLFRLELDPQRLFLLAIVTGVFAIVRQVAISVAGADSDTGGTSVGGVLGPLRTLIFLAPLSVAAATGHTILTSRGRRSIGAINGTVMGISLLFGIVGAGRQLMASSILIYLMTCIAFRYRFKARHYVVLLVGAYLAQFVLFPYALYARSYVRSGDFNKNVAVAGTLFVDILSNPVKYQQMQQEKDAKAESVAWRRCLYYGKPEPTLDRFSLIVVTDAIIDTTLVKGTTGTESIKPGIDMILPRFLNPDKPILSTGNYLGHRANGLVGKYDFVTQITTGFIPDAFSSYSWPGVAVISFLLAFAYFTIYRFLIADRLWQNVLALGLLFKLPWEFSGAPIASLILGVFQFPLTFAIVMWAIYYVVDHVIVLGRRRVRRPGPGRLTAENTSGGTAT